MNIHITYLSGNEEEFETTFLPVNHGAGCMLQHNILHMDSWREKGVRLTRSYWKQGSAARQSSDEGSEEIAELAERTTSELVLLKEEMLLIAPEDIVHVKQVKRNGEMFLIREGDRLMDIDEYAQWLEEGDDKEDAEGEDQAPISDEGEDELVL